MQAHGFGDGTHDIAYSTSRLGPRDGKGEETVRSDRGRTQLSARDVRRFRLITIEGPDKGSVWESKGDSCSVGSHQSNDLVVPHPTVSRFHCELKAQKGGVRIRDLDSRNGTVVDGVLICDAFLRSGSMLQLGGATLRFESSTERNRLPVSELTELGGLVGTSVAMRIVFALMERAAQTDATVLIEGETGTGKSQIAKTIHQTSARRDYPFLIVDCGAIPPTLLDSELFGHEKGAFTGATQDRQGVFEEAAGGTVFLDEIGELPADLQPKLLRAIEDREVRRLGTNTFRPVDIRVIAATNRDLRVEVNSGRFRPDLFYRLAVVRMEVPALRHRVEDITAIAERLLDGFGAPAEAIAELRNPEFLKTLETPAWSGNVRELRNHLERCLVFQDALAPEASGFESDVETGLDMPYREARKKAVAQFERRYLTELLEKHDGKAVEAAHAAEVDRAYFYRLLRKHGIKL